MGEAVESCQVLETSELFAGISPFVRDAVLSTARRRAYACSELIFFTDDPVKETFLLIEGCAKVTLVARNGEEVVLRVVAPGELVGELGLEAGRKQFSTAQAIQDCEVLVWTAETFKAALTRFPVLERKVNNILRRRIFEMENRICEVSTQLASKRLAHELVRLASQIGQKVNSHVEISIPQEVLAQMTAMTLFTTNRILRSWEDQGLLRVGRRCIEIHDSAGLSGLCL